MRTQVCQLQLKHWILQNDIPGDRIRFNSSPTFSTWALSPTTYSKKTTVYTSRYHLNYIFKTVHTTLFYVVCSRKQALAAYAIRLHLALPNLRSGLLSRSRSRQRTSPPTLLLVESLFRGISSMYPCRTNVTYITKYIQSHYKPVPFYKKSGNYSPLV